MADAQGDVKITISTIDKATAKIKEVEGALKNVGGTSGRVGTAIGGVMNLFAGGWTSVGATLNIVLGALSLIGRVAGAVFNAVASVVDKAVGIVGELGNKLLWVGGILSGLALAATAKFTQAALAMGGWAEQTKIAFATMLGSSSSAAKFLGELKVLALEMPFTFKGAIGGVRQLLAYGIAAKEVQRVMVTLSDTAAAFGGSDDMFQRIAIAIGQMKARGFPSGEEMRQLAQAGIPAWQMLAEKIGISIPEAMKRAESRAISADVAIEALLQGMEDRFGGLSKTMMRTLPGALSNLQDVWELGLMRLGEAVAPTATRLVKAVTAVISEFTESGKLEKVGERIASWFSPENVRRAGMFFINIYATARNVFNWLRDMWSRMIAAATDPNHLRTIARFFANIAVFGKQTFDWLREGFGNVSQAMKDIPILGPQIQVLDTMMKAGAKWLGMEFTKGNEFPTFGKSQTLGDAQMRLQIENALLGGIEKAVGGVKSLFGGPLPGAPLAALDKFIAAYEREAEPLREIQRNTQQTAQAAEKIAETAQRELGKIIGGGDVTQQLAARLRFGGPHGAGGAAGRIGRLAITVNVPNGTARDQDIAQQAAEKAVGAVAEALGLSSVLPITSMIRGATEG